MGSTYRAWTSMQVAPVFGGPVRPIRKIKENLKTFNQGLQTQTLFSAAIERCLPPRCCRSLPPTSLLVARLSLKATTAMGLGLWRRACILKACFTISENVADPPRKKYTLMQEDSNFPTFFHERLSFYVSICPKGQTLSLKRHLLRQVILTSTHCQYSENNLRKIVKFIIYLSIFCHSRLLTDCLAAPFSQHSFNMSNASLIPSTKFKSNGLNISKYAHNQSSQYVIHVVYNRLMTFVRICVN